MNIINSQMTFLLVFTTSSARLLHNGIFSSTRMARVLGDEIPSHPHGRRPSSFGHPSAKETTKYAFLSKPELLRSASKYLREENKMRSYARNYSIRRRGGPYY